MKPIRFLLVVALAMVFLPFQTATGCPAGPTDDVCCEEDGWRAEDAAPGANDHPADEGCCPGGCTHCFLTCCGGSVAILSNAVPGLVAPTRGSIVPVRNDVPSIDPERVFHPPRA